MDKLSRRGFLKGSLAVAALPLVDAAAPGVARAATLGEAKLGDRSAFSSAGINWRQFAGTTLSFAASANPWVTAIQPRLAEFTRLTGIKVQMSTLGENEFVTKLPVTLSSGASTPDAFMVNEIGQAISARWMVPINDFLEDRKITNKAWYDPKDFFPAALAFPTVKGVQWAAPITAEVQVIFARKDLVPHAPRSFPALEAAAARAAKEGKIAGIAMRAVADPSETPWPVGGFVFSYGGYYIDPEGKPTFTSPAVLEAVGVYTDLLRKYGPRGVTSFGWQESEQAYENGQAAMFSDSSAFASALLNPATSKDAKKTTIYQLPKHNGMSRPNVWYWTVGINKHSKAAKAAWLFVQWATSKPTYRAIAAVTGTAPRSSAWASPALAKSLGHEAASAIHDALHGANSKPMALAWTNANWTPVATALAQGVSSIVAGQSSVKSAMAQVQSNAIKALKAK